MPLEVHVAIMKRLRHLCPEWLAQEQAQKGCNWHRLHTILNWAKVVPEEEPLVIQQVPQCKGRMQCGFVKKRLKPKSWWGQPA